MEQYEIDLIKNTLSDLHFVKWDRYYGESNHYTFFGWIDREDSYKDFLVLNIELDKIRKNILISFSTSSKKHSKRIAKILRCGHLNCNRIEYFCDLDNVIKEKDVKSGDDE